MSLEVFDMGYGMHINTDINISTDGIIESKIYKDLYFSRDGGLEETKHVFIQGNHLEQRFQNCKQFRIVELGFGTGLNFLATINTWKQYHQPEKFLHYVSVEKYPLSISQIINVLKHWEELPLKLLEEYYPHSLKGEHSINIESSGVLLTLIFRDVSEALKLLPDNVDAWFLDGFSPSKNPEMWSDQIFLNMARLSNINATFATFTAASLVRKGLESVGFNVVKSKGFGRKREMLTGEYLSGRGH